MLYNVLGLVVDSEIELLDFSVVADGHHSLRIRNASSPLHTVETLRWKEARRDPANPSSEIAWQFAWDHANLYVAIPHVGEFVLDTSTATLTGFRYPTTRFRPFQRQLSFNVLPRALGELAHFVVHASAVRFDSDCVLFVGASGDGKSTLAASFAEDGELVMSDDCVRLEPDHGGLSAWATGGALRLWDDSLAMIGGPDAAARPLASTPDRGVKWTCPSGPAVAPSRVRVRGIFDISSAVSREENVPLERPVLAPITHAAVLSMLSRGLLLFDWDGRTQKPARFLRMTAVAEACPPVFTLRYPRRFGVLPDVRATIRAAVHEDDGPARTDRAS